MCRFILVLVAALSLSGAAHAQTYPSQSETPVTDDGELLTPVQEAELSEKIIKLEQDNNSDIAVVTLPATQFYTMGDDIDVYARGLISNWEMDGAENENYVLLLVFRDDRELHLELAGDFDVNIVEIADSIINSDIVPKFREDDYAGGIFAGIDALETRVFATAAEAAPASPSSTASSDDAEGGSNILLYIGGGIAALIALVVGANRRAKAKLAATPCPSCGKAGELSKERITLQEATETAEGRGETRTTCGACGHSEAVPYTISRKEPKEPEKKEGGGASGEW